MADTTNRGGRPSAEVLRQRMIEEILDRHADGEALVDICKSFDPPLPPRTFRSWVRKAQEGSGRLRKDASGREAGQGGEGTIRRDRPKKPSALLPVCFRLLAR
jgi:transposase-like protein